VHVTCQSGRATVEVHDIIIWNWITEISVLKVIESGGTLRTLDCANVLARFNVLLGANVIGILKPGADFVILCASKERFTSMHPMLEYSSDIAILPKYLH